MNIELQNFKDTERDPNLLSDDEVFLDSSASAMTSSVTSPVPVVVRAQHTAVQQVVARGERVRTRWKI